MSNASTTIRLRRILFDRLPADVFDRINMTTMAKVMDRLGEQGWTPDDVASQILGDYGDGDPAALVVARANRLSGPPPRDSTPQPPPFSEVHAAIHARHTPAHTPAEWAARIRGQHTQRRQENTP